MEVGLEKGRVLLSPPPPSYPSSVFASSTSSSASSSAHGPAGASSIGWHGMPSGWSSPRTASSSGVGGSAASASVGGSLVRLAYGLVIIALATASLLALLSSRLDADARLCADPASVASQAPTLARPADPPAFGHGVSILDGPAPARVPPGLKIAVLTMYVRGEDPRGPSNRTRVVNYADKTADIADISLQNMRNYCDLHGYDLLVIDHSLDAGRPLVWSKLVGMMRHLPDYDWLLYMDGDALFSNFSVTIEERIQPPENGDHCRRIDGVVRPAEFFVAAHAINDTLNSGVLLMKNTTGVMDLLMKIYSSYSRGWNGLQDNRAVSMLLTPDSAPDFVCRLKGDYARWLQSSVHTTVLTNDGNFVPGDWIVHFAGPCAPWCRIAAQLTNLCATYPHLRECATALTREGWQPMSPYGKIVDPALGDR